MSISAKYIQEHKNDPAVLSCRTEEGAVDIVTGFGAADVDEVVEQATISGAGTRATACKSMIKVDIAEGKNIHIEIPMGLGLVSDSISAIPFAAHSVTHPAVAELKPTGGAKVVHKLTRKQFGIKKVVIGDETKFEAGVLTVRKSIENDAVLASSIIKTVEIDIISPDKQDVYTHSMMDICPIAVKKEGKLGEGLTYEFTGAVVMLTGVEESGKECSDAASSDGIFNEKCIFGRPGAPDEGDYVIRMHVVIENGYQMERPGPMAAHQAADILTQEIRNVLKNVNVDLAESTLVMDEIRHPGAPKVVYVKEIMGQGAMHDNLILPTEPCGFLGARPNVDLGNVPIFLRTNEVRDGGIHALTCITPDTKETTRHYWREPLLKRLAEDDEIDFLGVLFVGSPQACTEKFYVSERVGATVEAMGVDGCIISTEGFGNNHVDFASHHEQIGKLGIPVVGTSFCGAQGALVVGNQYMDAMVDMAVSNDGWETDNLAEQTLTPEVAARCHQMLKNKMMGIETEKASKKFNPLDIEYNQKEVAKIK